jgi:hypothetical protein
LSIPFRPRHSDARFGLKQLKEYFDDSSFDSHELMTEFNVRRSINDAVSAYRGEFLHQLGLRKQARGEFSAAERLYKLSLAELSENPLAQARTLRDWGMMVTMHVDRQRGMKMLDQALLLHDHDVDNSKGRRQRLITQSYVWRAQIVQNSAESNAAKRKLIALATGPDFAFCVRDQKVIIDFLIPRTRGPLHRDLLGQQAAILLERKQPLALARTCTLLVMDINLSIAMSIVHRLRRKE